MSDKYLALFIRKGVYTLSCGKEHGATSLFFRCQKEVSFFSSLMQNHKMLSHVDIYKSYMKLIKHDNLFEVGSYDVPNSIFQYCASPLHSFTAGNCR